MDSNHWVLVTQTFLLSQRFIIHNTMRHSGTCTHMHKHTLTCMHTWSPSSHLSLLADGGQMRGESWNGTRKDSWREQLGFHSGFNKFDVTEWKKKKKDVDAGDTWHNIAPEWADAMWVCWRMLIRRCHFRSPPGSHFTRDTVMPNGSLFRLWSNGLLWCSKLYAKILVDMNLSTPCEFSILFKQLVWDDSHFWWRIVMSEEAIRILTVFIKTWSWYTAIMREAVESKQWSYGTKKKNNPSSGILCLLQLSISGEAVWTVDSLLRLFLSAWQLSL